MREKRMILIGEADSKRTKFFLKAADRQQVPMEFCTWSEWKKKDIEGGVVKIDPPSFQEYNILQLPKRIQEYREQLLELEEKGKKKEVCFLNPPTGILQLLDKVACKEKLKKYQGVLQRKDDYTRAFLKANLKTDDYNTSKIRMLIDYIIDQWCNRLQ